MKQLMRILAVKDTQFMKRDIAMPPRAARFMCLLCIALMLTGCALIDNRTAEELVAERSLERAILLQAGDFEGAYAYTTPGYRSVETLTDYTARWVGGPNWVEAEPVRVTCNRTPVSEPDRCQVALRIVFRQFRAAPIQTHLQEIWLLSGRQWFLYQEL